MKLRPKLATQLVIVLAASGIAVYALAAPDYDRIRKDINVMIGIVKSSFENSDNCRSCKVRVTGHYLADQGVVFNVDPSGGGYRYAWHAGDFEKDVEVFADSMAAIPGFVHDILRDVEVRLEDKDIIRHVTITSDEEAGVMGREARHRLREARAEIREAMRELREMEIEAIHADAEELQEIEEREAELEREVARLEEEEASIQQDIAGHIEKRSREQELRRARKEEERQKRFEEMETIVLNTFCDYSRTIRSLPSGERVSVIVNRDEGKSNIYVFEQSDLKDCNSTEADVRTHALSYAF